jgi:hypothetical protein
MMAERQIVLTGESVKPVEGEEGKFTITLPDNVVTEAEINANFKSVEDYQRLENGVQERLNTAITNAKTGAAEDLLKDDDFLNRAVKERMEFFKEKFPGEQVDLDQVREQFRSEEVTPLQERFDATEAQNVTLKEGARKGEIQRGMSATGVADKERPLMEAYVDSRTIWSEEHGRPVVKGDTGEVITKVVDGKQIPITVEMFLSDLKAAGDFKHAFNAKVKDGAGINLSTTTPENIDEQIGALEREGKFAEAGVLKAKKLEMAAGRIPGQS